jgi:hypothetical protein
MADDQLELFDPFNDDLGATQMGKVVSSGSQGVTFAKGGSQGMFGKGTAGPATAGQSGKASNDLGSEKWAKGGKSGQMFGKGVAGAKTSGVSGKTTQSG